MSAKVLPNMADEGDCARATAVPAVGPRTVGRGTAAAAVGLEAVNGILGKGNGIGEWGDNISLL